MTRRAKAFFLAILISSFLSVDSRAISLSKEQLFQVASLAARDGEHEKAIEFFKKVLEIDPKFSPAYHSLGLVYQAMGGDSGVVDSLYYFNLAVEMDPSFVESWNSLGRVYYASEQFVQAEKAFLKSLELRPDQTDIEFVLGWVYLIGQSRAELAIKYFKLGLMNIDDEMAHYGLGLGYILLGDKFKVLDEITYLRRKNREDLGSKLEAMVRGNIEISSTPGAPLITGAHQDPSLFDKELEALTTSGFNAGDGSKGIRVRLKGPLKD